MSGASRAETGSEVVGATHEEAIGVHRFAWANPVVPPTFTFGDDVALRVCPNACDVMRGVQGVADQDSVAFVCIQGAIGFVGQLVAGQVGAAAQLQRLLETHGVWCDDHLLCPKES